MNITHKLKDEIISELDFHASTDRKVGVEKRIAKGVKQVPKYLKRAGFVRHGKYALGKLTRQQHERMSNIKANHVPDK